MKPKNKTKKYKQKGGEIYTLTKKVFDELYNTIKHSDIEGKNQTLNDEITDEIFALFPKDNNLVITVDTKFIKIEDIYEREKEIYSNDFKQFISDSKQILNDIRISKESKYIKISDSFSKLCFDDSFKNKFIKHLVNLRYITLYNHKILLLQLKQCIINMYHIIGNCDSGIIEKNMPIELRSLLFNFITNPIRNISNSAITFIKTNLLLIEDQLSLSNSPPPRSSLTKFTDDINSIGIQTILFPENLTPQTPTIRPLTQQQLTPQQVIEGQQIQKNIISDLQNKSIINSTRTGFTLLVNFYDTKTVSALDLIWDIENDDVGTAIEKNNTKNSLKNALNAELTRIKILASDPNNTTHISAVVRSLGFYLIPVSLGLSFIGGMIIDLILNKIYELDIIKTLNENKLYNSNFIESKQKFLSILYKSKEEIQASSINNCRPDERIDKYTQAYELYNKHTNDFFNNYDNYLQDFINFKYIYNLLCDKTKEQIVNYIDSDIEIDADANVIDADANEIVADANEIVADDIEQKVNKLYDRLQRGTCYARDGVLILYHLKDITKGFVDGNERNEVEKKAILRKAIISTNGIWSFYKQLY